MKTFETWAIETVARHVLANAVAEYPISPEWENYPDIGEYAWDAVLAEARRLASVLARKAEHYDAAYRHLAERAEGEPA